MIIYSLASPRRTDPKTGEVYKSVLKPIGVTYTNKNLNTDKRRSRRSPSSRRTRTRSRRP